MIDLMVYFRIFHEKMFEHKDTFRLWCYRNQKSSDLKVNRVASQHFSSSSQLADLRKVLSVLFVTLLYSVHVCFTTVSGKRLVFNLRILFFRVFLSKYSSLDRAFKYNIDSKFFMMSGTFLWILLGIMSNRVFPSPCCFLTMLCLLYNDVLHVDVRCGNGGEEREWKKGKEYNTNTTYNSLIISDRIGRSVASFCQVIPISLRGVDPLIVFDC